MARRSPASGALPHVAIVRSTLGRPSEQYIQDQHRLLTRYDSTLIGARAWPASEPGGQSLVMSEMGALGRLSAAGFSVAGWAPGLTHALRSRGISLIHAHFGTDAIRLLRTARVVHVPLITTYHGFDATRSDASLKVGRWGDRWYLRSRERLASQGALHVAVSEFVRRSLIERGFPEDRTVTNYLGVNTDFFQPGDCEREENVVLFVGRLHKIKGCLDVLEAVSRIPEHLRHVRVVFVGDGALSREIQITARKLRINCELTGPLARSEVRNWLRRSTVLVGPSKTCQGAQEALGLVFAEAQATGLPVLAYDSGGVGEIVTHGVSGLLSPEGDVGDLSANLSRVLEDKHLRARLGAAGIQFVRRNFDCHRQLGRLESLYDRVLNL